ncbi:MAG: hypothetical protein PHU26_06135 [Methanofollis liminatans]|jgi:hypothetical protein|uniref:Uncharacterized protein n=1 Tax=Methanofollis liminatans DSM 4140 TaxID=28892 RepID=J1KZW3_9EURY|nr:hypothetical protein [Methanofollis liminatans]EJG06287.1 hypothetical protein Metli_0315 [Methanofollis liminatans DSM 4140]MDD3111855.1 hypothetical protein [Methanofollis liminatans]
MARINDDALMSIDFLAGFTIFLLSLIVAAGMVPGMLAGLQSATIDYDGVAYRTSVILAEDPGWFEDVNGGVGSRWEIKRDDEIQRMGLAVSKETPNILSIAKVARFLNQTKYREDPAFYRSRVFFSDIPYSFNITLKAKDESFEYHLGDETPDGEYGSIRRVVLVKNASSARLDFSNESVLKDYAADPATAPGATSTFSVSLNFTDLLAPSPAYRVDPLGEEIAITLDNLDKTQNETAVNASLTKVTLKHDSKIPITETQSTRFILFRVDGEIKKPPIEDGDSPINVSSNISLLIKPGLLYEIPYRDRIDVVFEFENTENQNTNITGTFPYTPTDLRNVTKPLLKPAVLEVAVW